MASNNNQQQRSPVFYEEPMKFDYSGEGPISGTLDRWGQNLFDRLFNTWGLKYYDPNNFFSTYSAVDPRYLYGGGQAELSRYQPSPGTITAGAGFPVQHPLMAALQYYLDPMTWIRMGGQSLGGPGPQGMQDPYTPYQYMRAGYPQPITTYGKVVPEPPSVPLLE